METLANFTALFHFSPASFCVVTLEVHGRVSLWACVGAHMCVQHSEVSGYKGNINYIVSNSWSGGIGSFLPQRPRKIATCEIKLNISSPGV